MADNVTAGSNDAGGPVFASDDDGTAQWPYAKLAWGADNTQTKVASGASAIPIQDGGNTITVDGTVAVSGTVTVDASGAAVPVTDNAGSLTVDAPVATPVFVRLSDGAAAISTLPVSLATVPSHAVTNAGTFAVQVDGAALTALQLIDNASFADDAAFTVGSSGVGVIGGLAVSCGSAPDAADAGDAAAPIMTVHRQQWVIGGHPNAKSCVYNTTGAQTDDTIMAAIAGGTKYAVTRITVALDEATTVGVAVRIGLGTANVPALGASGADATDDVLFYHPGLVPGSVHTVGDGSAVLGVGADGAELRVTCEAPTSGTLGIVVTYFPLPS